MDSFTKEASLLPSALAEANCLREIVAQLSEARGERRQALSDSIHQRLDRLIETLLNDYSDDDQVTVSEVKPILEKHRDFTEAGFHGVEDRLIPLVIVRELVSRHKMALRQTDLPVWPRFVNRFKAVCQA